MTPLPPPLIAAPRMPGALAWLIAATCLLMMLAAALVLALLAAARGIARTTARQAIVQVVDADPAARDAAADRILLLLQRAPGILSSHRVSPNESAQLIAPYIGGMNASDLPLPVLIDVTARSPAAIARAVQAVPTARVTPAGPELAPLTRLIIALRSVAASVALVAAAATGLIAVLTARAALAREAATLDILHALGATDRQLSRLITGRIAREAAIGAIAGLTVATVTIRLVVHRLAALGIGADGIGAGWPVLLLLPLALVALAIAAAQTALLLTLRRAP